LEGKKNAMFYSVNKDDNLMLTTYFPFYFQFRLSIPVIGNPFCFFYRITVANTPDWRPILLFLSNHGSQYPRLATHFAFCSQFR
jgi:hypothetical protein